MTRSSWSRMSSAIIARRHDAEGGRPSHDGRGRRRADLHRADAVRRVRSVGLPLRHFRQFFRQFAVTIAASTVISCFVSLTLSPALCAVLFKAHEPGHERAARPAWHARLLAGLSIASIAASSGCRPAMAG